MNEDREAFLSVATGVICSGRPLFDRSRSIFVARAPGRLDLMGGFADYSGSLTLETPIAEAAFVAVQRSTEARIRLVSAATNEKPERVFEFSLDDAIEHASTWASARRFFSQSTTSAWAGYVGGALTALAEDFATPLKTGLDVLLWSRVPEGKGVSSSAAIEVATLYALAGALGVRLEPVAAALSCQHVENLVVGAPCGVMDQMTSSSGVAGQILPLLCQPATLEACFSVPDGLAIWGIDSGIRHQISGASYGDVRVAAFMGYRIIADKLSMPVFQTATGRVRVVDRHFDGFLANVPAQKFRAELSRELPERMRGRDFLRLYGGITDPVTEVRPEATYRVQAATAHPVFEHQRASEFRQIVREYRGESDARRLGALMQAAHDSYSACRLGSTRTDRLVELANEEGPQAGIFGAKITGGGSGGTVAVLGRVTAATAINRIAGRYAAETGNEPYVFSGSSHGAAAHGVLESCFRDGRFEPLEYTPRPEKAT